MANLWRGLIRCLDAHDLTRQVCRNLLRHHETLFRSLAREVLLPAEARRLAGAGVDVPAFRRSVEALCPSEGIDARIEVCRRLQKAGAPSSAAAACQQEWELDRLIPCPQCQQHIRRRDEGEHLRTAHGFYEFRGVRLHWEQLLKHLARCLFAGQSDSEAAQSFLHQNRPRGQALERFGDAVLEEVAARGDHCESPARQSALRLIAALPFAGALMEYLLKEGLSPQAGELGLALYASMATPSGDSAERVAPWLAHTAIPMPIRMAALQILLGTARSEDELVHRAVERFVAGTPDKVTALRLLQTMTASAPHNVRPALTSSMETSIRLKCPRCNVSLTIQQMRDHLWNEHRLLLDLDGLRYLEPWGVIRNQLDRYKTSPNETILEYCLTLATRIDSRLGPRDVAKLAWQRGIDAPCIRQILASLSPEEMSEITALGAPSTASQAPLSRLFAWCGKVFNKAPKQG